MRVWVIRIYLQHFLNFDFVVLKNSISFYSHFEGEIPIKHSVIGKYYPTNRLRERIGNVSNSLMENGLYQFYLELYKQLNNMKIGFKLSRQQNSEDVDDDDNLRALTMKQLIRPFYLAFGLLAASVLVFIGEIFHFKWMTRRDRSKYSHQFNIQSHTQFVFILCSVIFVIITERVKTASFIEMRKKKLKNKRETVVNKK